MVCIFSLCFCQLHWYLSLYDIIIISKYHYILVEIDIKTIELEVSEGINPKRVVYLCTKDERRIPLTPVQEPLELSLIEKQATNLAKFLDVNLSLK